MDGRVKWLKMRRKSGGYRSDCGRYLLSPITAPVGPGLPSFVLYGLPGFDYLGTHHTKGYAADWLYRRGVRRQAP